MDNEVKIWECNGYVNGVECSYLISDAEMKQFRFDYGCPRCGLSFEDFTLKTYKDKVSEKCQ